MARQAKRRYRALVGLSYPADPQIVERLLAGETIPMDQRGMKEVPAGEVVDDIPSCSVPRLLERGRIEEVTDPG